MPACRVEAWTHDLACGGMLGASHTEADGAFVIEVRGRVTAVLLRVLRAKVFFKVLRGSDHLASTDFLWHAKRPDDDVLIELDAASSRPPFAVRGRVRAPDGAALAQTPVRAFDKDLRHEELLGEARTDADGDYTITYVQGRFRRAEKLRADLIVRAYDAEGGVAAESEVVFNAPDEATVHLVAGIGSVAGLSEYERCLAEIEPVLDGVAIHDLTDEDIAFLVGEADADPRRIRALRAAHRSQVRSGVTAAAFYGFEREGIGAELSLVLAAPEVEWRGALERALDGNVIPAGVRAQLEAILKRLQALRGSAHPVDAKLLAEAAPLAIAELKGRFGQLFEQLRDLWVERTRRALDALDPPSDVGDVLRRLDLGAAFGAHADLATGIRSLSHEAEIPDRQRAALIAWLDRADAQLPPMPGPDTLAGDAIPELGGQLDRGQVLFLLEAAGLDPEASSAITAEVSAVSALHDAALTRLVARGSLTQATAQRAGMLATMTGLLGSVSDARRIADVLARQGRTTLRELAGMAPDMWRQACEEAGIPARAGSPADEAITRIAGAFPRTALSAAVAHRAPALDTAGVAHLQALQAREPELLSDRADLAALPPEERATAEAWRRFLRMHPGLGLESMLQGEPDRAVASVRSRLSSLAAVESALGEDLGPDLSDAHLAQRFPALPAVERRAVGTTLRARTRVLAVAQHPERAAALMAAGYDSVTRIALANPQVLSSRLGLSPHLAGSLHDRALQTAQDALRPLWFKLDLKPEIGWLGRIVPDSRDFPRELQGIDHLFGGGATCECEHCRSVLSPAAYFVDLMHLVERRILSPSFAGRGGSRRLHALHLRARRPDLWALPLTCENATRDVLYLDIVRPVLARYIVSDGQPQRELEGGPALDENDESVVVRAFTQVLARNVSSFAQPFSHAHHAAETALAAWGSSLGALAAVLRGPDRLTLSMSTGQASAVVRAFDPGRAESDARALSDVYDLRAADDTPLAIPATGALAAGSHGLDIVQLVKASALRRDDVAEVLAARFVSAGGATSITPVRSADGLQIEWEGVQGLRATNLDRFHRFVRLLRHTPWSARELDLLLEHSRAAELEAALPILARAKRVQDHLGIDVETLAAILGPLPVRSLREGEPALGQRLFGAKVVGTEPAPELPGPVEYLHPAFELTTPAPDTSYDLTARLLAGLEIDDASLQALLGALAPVLHIDLGSPDRARRAFRLDAGVLGTLLRHARVARALRLSIRDLFRVLGAFGRGTHLSGVGDVLALIDDVAWLRASAYSLDEITALTSGASAPVDEDRIQLVIETTAEEGRLSFADTVFASVPEISAELSRSLVRQNEGRFARIGDTGLLRLADAFDPEAALAVPADLLAIEPELRDRLRSHLPVQVLAAAAAEVLQSSSDQVLAWLSWSGIAADELARGLLGDLAVGGRARADLASALGALRRAQLATRGLTPADVRLIGTHAAAFGPASASGVPIETLRAIETYRRLRSSRASTADWDRLLGSHAGSGFTETEILGRVLQLDPAAAAALQGAGSLPARPIEALSWLAAAAGFVRTFGISGGGIAALLGDEEAALERAANELWASIPKAKQEDALRRLRNLERDALVDYLLRAFRAKPLDLSPFRTADDLYGYFLLDVQMDGCAHTTRLAAAISSVQLYAQRVRIGLEQDRRPASDPAHLQVTADIDDGEWEWRKSYRLWEANRKIFLHPECHLESFTRDDRTPLFKAFEEELLQAKNLDEQAALDAYASYLKGFEEIATLTLAGAFHDRSSDVVHLFGATPSEPPTYYHRAVKGLASSLRDQASPVSWGTWQKADIRIPVRHVSPTLVAGRLVVFWLTSTTSPETSFVNGSSRFDRYKHRLSLQYSWQQPNGTWTSPQKLPLDSDGVLFETPSTSEPEDGHQPSNPLLRRVYTHARSTGGLDVTVPLYVAPPQAGDTSIRLHEQSVFRRRVNLLRQESQGLGSATRSGRRVLVEWRAGTRFPTSYIDLHLLINPLLAASVAPRAVPVSHVTPPASNSGLTLRPGFHGLWLTDVLSDNLDWHCSAAATIRDWLSMTQLSEGNADRIFHRALMQLHRGDRVEPAEGFVFLVENSSTPLLLVSEDDQGSSFALTRVGSALVDEMRQRLFVGGVDELLSLDTQQLQEPPTRRPVSDLVEDRTPSRVRDWKGPMAVYWRELFFHIPLLLAAHCSSQGRFEAAKRWLSHVFDPTAGGNPEQVWRYAAFRHLDAETLRDRLRDPEALAAYHDDPFNPHAIARIRPTAYAKGAFLQYVENLIDWGDSLFTRFTRESVNEATQLYVFAQSLLGQKPLSTPRCQDGPSGAQGTPRTYEQLSGLIGETSEVLVTIEDFAVARHARRGGSAPTYVLATGARSDRPNAAQSGSALSGKSWTMPRLSGAALGPLGTQAPRGGLLSDTPELSLVRQLNLVFCVPGGEKVDHLRRLVEDRLFKIRHCQNIHGEIAHLLPFEPALDPDLVAAARAAGLSLDDVLQAGAGRVPPYRFTFIVERAKGQASALAAIGSALLAAIEKKEGEELARLRLVHQKNLSLLTAQVREDEVRIAEEAVTLLERRKEAAVYRRDYHQQLIDETLSPGEMAQQALQHDALHHRAASATLSLASAVAHLVAQVGAPTAMKYGGREVGSSLGQFSSAVGQLGGMIEALASFTGAAAAYGRRAQAWEHARTLAEHDIRQIDGELAAAHIRLSIARRSLALYEESERQLDEVIERYEGKLAGLGLYTFYATQLTRLYRTAFDGALSLARLAERALRYERGGTAPTLRGDYWDATHAGLLAGERLLYDLMRLEQWFLETHERKLEVDQTFALSQVDPQALWELKSRGDCSFTLPELYFDLAYPGHYRRRIRAVRLTIPAIAGPYVNVSAMLELTGGRICQEPGGALEDVALQRTSRMATSSAQNDGGVFELSFGDARYLPFEGEPAVSDWRLRLPAAIRSFDYGSIDDVLVHIAYTAEYDEDLRGRKEGTLATLQATLATYFAGGFPRVISFRREFGGVLSRLQRSPAGTAIPFELKREHWPFFLRGSTLSVHQAAIVVQPAPGVSLTGLVVEVDGTRVGDFVIDAETGIARSSDAASDALRAALGAGLVGEHRISLALGSAAIEARVADVLLEIVVRP